MKPFVVSFISHRNVEVESTDPVTAVGAAIEKVGGFEKCKFGTLFVVRDLTLWNSDDESGEGLHCLAKEEVLYELGYISKDQAEKYRKDIAEFARKSLFPESGELN